MNVKKFTTINGRQYHIPLYGRLYVVLHYIFDKHRFLDDVSDSQSRPHWRRVRQTNIPPLFTLEQSIRHMEMPAINCVESSARLLCPVPAWIRSPLVFRCAECSHRPCLDIRLSFGALDRR